MAFLFFFDQRSLSRGDQTTMNIDFRFIFILHVVEIINKSKDDY